MAEPEKSPGPQQPGDSFRWQGLFQQAAEPIFLLNQQRRILTVNTAWEQLTGLKGQEARGLACTRRQQADANLGPLLLALSPPAEVMEGRVGRVRRRIPAGKMPQRWWDIDFFPFQDGRGRLRVLAKIIAVAVEENVAPVPVPEKLLALRDKLDLRFSLDELRSQHLSMRRVLEQVRLAGQTRTPFLVVGEPGTGKEWVARTVHHQGDARERYFAALDCGRLPPGALENALFGEGGVLQQPGFGMLYLKDVAALPRDLQSRVTDFMEGNSPGVRIAAGAGSELLKEVHRGHLLDRLHCLLSTLVISLPPLRERLDDLPGIVEPMLPRLNAGESGKRITGLTPEAWQRLRTYAWPGNLRELFAVLASAWAETSGELIEEADLPAYLKLSSVLHATPGAAPEKPLALDSILETVERRLIALALKRAQGNKSRAADLLSIWRPRLLRRLEALRIEDSGPDAEKKKASEA